MAKGQKPQFDVFVSRETGGKNHYTRIGAAWNVAKGGISIKLSALPVDGALVLFPFKAEE